MRNIQTSARRALGRLSYANVVATLALFVALGASSYAAVKLTGEDIANSSLTGKDVDNRSLTAKDLKKGTLTGGPPGAQGPPGSTLATVTFAVMGSNGQVSEHSPGVVLTPPQTARNGVGVYSVGFGRNVAQCGAVATPGSTPSMGGTVSVPAVSARVFNNGGTVTVTLLDAAGDPIDSPFTVSVLC